MTERHEAALQETRQSGRHGPCPARAFSSMGHRTQSPNVREPTPQCDVCYNSLLTAGDTGDGGQGLTWEEKQVMAGVGGVGSRGSMRS